MKKIGKILLSAILCVSTLLSAAGCKDKACTHNVGTWEVITPATCVSTGVQKGICGICYEDVEEVIPVDEEAHSYGEWDITALPSETEKGSALKVCGLDESHKLNIVLPVLSDPDYQSSITTRPSATGDGVRTYNLKHNEGKISFTKPVPATGILLVRDAVELGVGEESRDLVRSASGTMGYKFYEEGTKPKRSSTEQHSYEFGDNYTHIVDGSDNCEIWYFTDEEGVLYGLTDKDGQGKIVKHEGDKRYIEGSRLYIHFYGGGNTLGFSYGVEALLDRLYRLARWSSNNDFVEYPVESVDGKDVYSFSYGEVQNSGEDSGYFTQTKVSFTLTQQYVVDSFKSESTVYVNNRNQVDEDQNPLPDVITWEMGENNIAKVIEGQEEGCRYVSTVQFTQTPKTPEDVVPENEHSIEDMYVQSFELTYEGQVLQENGLLPNGEKAQFASGKVTQRIFGITNVKPSSALRDYAMDEFTFYLRTTEDGKIVDKEITFGTMLSVGMAVDMDSNKKFFLNAKQKGEQTVVVKTKNVERVIQCNIGASLPTAIYPAVYEYKNGGYVWDYGVETETTQISKTVYANQPLTFTIDVPKTEKNYAFATYALLDENDQEIDISTSNRFVNTSISYNGVSMGVTQFISNETGEHTIKIVSKDENGIYTNVGCTIVVNVVAAPTIEELSQKTYEAKDMLVPNGEEWYELCNVEVRFTTAQSTDDGKTWTMTATITTDKATETVSCTYTSETRELTSSHSGGAELGFKLALNSGYDFVLSVNIEVAELVSEEVLTVKQQA